MNREGNTTRQILLDLSRLSVLTYPQHVSSEPNSSIAIVINASSPTGAESCCHKSLGHVSQFQTTDGQITCPKDSMGLAVLPIEGLKRGLSGGGTRTARFMECVCFHGASRTMGVRLLLGHGEFLNLLSPCHLRRFQTSHLRAETADAQRHRARRLGSRCF